MSQPSDSSTSGPNPGTGGKSSLAVFGPNEWLVDEIYQQYLKDPKSRGPGLVGLLRGLPAAGRLRGLDQRRHDADR